MLRTAYKFKRKPVMPNIIFFEEYEGALISPHGILWIIYNNHFDAPRVEAASNELPLSWTASQAVSFIEFGFSPEKTGPWTRKWEGNFLSK